MGSKTLPDQQKETRVQILTCVLGLFEREGDTFLNSVITSDETRVVYDILRLRPEGLVRNGGTKIRLHRI
jgi:hypothetical protein